MKRRFLLVFKEHGVMLYLSRELYSGWVKLQADRDLGRTYAGLLPFVEGLYRLGYISKEVYDENIKKYSEPLNATEKTILEDQDQIKSLKEKDMQFKGMLEAWDIPHLKSNWRQYAIAEAKKYPGLEYAKLILAKEGERVI
jgi:hypothetical protein